MRLMEEPMVVHVLNDWRFQGAEKIQEQRLQQLGLQYCDPAGEQRLSTQRKLGLDQSSDGPTRTDRYRVRDGVQTDR